MVRTSPTSLALAQFNDIRSQEVIGTNPPGQEWMNTMDQPRQAHFYTKPLRDQVYDYLKMELESQRLIPGEIITIRKLSEELGVSRTTLKDALLGLQAKGFVTFLPQKGVMINKLTLQEIQEIYQIIGALEASIILLENKRFDSSFVAQLTEINSKIRAAIDSKDVNGYWKHNRLFHQKIVQATRNTRLLEISESLRKRLYDFPVPEKFDFDWGTRCTDEHFEIIQLMACQNFREAAIFLQEIHWSFIRQVQFVKSQYF